MTKRLIELREYGELFLDPELLSEPEAKYLYSEYRDKVAIDPPAFTGRWKLTSSGWVGYIPVSSELGLSLQPKVPISNLFRMLEYAYDLKSFQLFDTGITGSKSLEDFFAELASILAKRVLDRARKGLYCAYVGRRDRLPYVRGSVDIRERLRRPWRVNLACEFEEHTPDVEENQILAWTLLRIARTGACGPRVQPTVRQAFRTVRGFSSPQSFSPEVCVGRLYNRLNQDYEPLHALCRFFLEHTGPTHAFGERKMVPFLVNMARLFELFVARWLEQHVPAGSSFRREEKVRVGPKDELEFRVDLVLYDEATWSATAVLDTKYKAADGPSNRDVEQVVTYAKLKNCTQAGLIYPQPLARPLDVQIGDVRVRSLAFDLGVDLEQAGGALLEQLSRWQKPPAGEQPEVGGYAALVK